MKVDEQKLKEWEKLKEASTPVVAWYANPWYGRGQVRGPYMRWFEIVGPPEAEIQRDQICRADYVDDVKYAAAALTHFPDLIEAVRERDAENSANALLVLDLARKLADKDQEIKQLKETLKFIVTGPERHDNTPEAHKSNRDRLRIAVAKACVALEKTITLSDRDRDLFVESIINPPEPTEALKDLMKPGDKNGR